VDGLVTEKLLNFRKYVPLIIIVVLAGLLRTYQTGAEFFGGDDAYISIKAVQIARYGETHLLGPPSSLGLVHSPLSVYLYAIPYLISPDPVGAQIFTGLMNTLAVAILYLITLRYFGTRAAIIASLLYAVHPHMVFASRVINNAQIGAPFVLLYLLSGLLGYYENKGWARIMHLPLLSLAGQCHPHTFALAPLSVMIFIQSMIVQSDKRRMIFMQTLIGAGVFLLLLVPWSIGIYGFAEHVDILHRVQNMPSTGEIQDQIMFGGIGHIVQSIYHLERISDNWLKPLQAIITIVAIVWMFYRSIRARRILPGLTIILCFMLVPIVTWLIQAHWVVDYWWPSLPAVFMIQGVLLGGISKRNRFSSHSKSTVLGKGLSRSTYLKWLGSILALVLSFTHLVEYLKSDYPPPPVSLDELVNAMEVAVTRSNENDKELVVLLADGHRGLPWAFLREYALLKYGLEGFLVEPDQPIPIPMQGAVLIGDGNNDSRNTLFIDGETTFARARLAFLPSQDQFDVDVRSVTPFVFENQVTVNGFYLPLSDSKPVPGETWTIFMIMESNSVVAEDFKVFVHVVDEYGNKYAQSDQRGLGGQTQTKTSMYASQFDLLLSNDLPVEGNLYLHFGMYDDSGQVKLLEINENAISDIGDIQIRGVSPAISVWPNGLELLEVEIDNQIQQGPPVIVKTNWYSSSDLLSHPKVQWNIYDTDDNKVFQDIINIIPADLNEFWPQGVFYAAMHELRVPTDLQPGKYTLELDVTDTSKREYFNQYEQSFEIIERERIYDFPDPSKVVGVVFSDKIKLIGYELDSDQSSLNLTLVWQAAGNITKDYKYFVHISKQDKVVAQVDSMPQKWAYPTSWWATGEFVVDELTFDISNIQTDDYVITLGFYDPEDGKRLRVHLPNGKQFEEDRVSLQ
tara:strand:+ start:99923 stop:102649 length:2727 start_codon:yes stop_codon:yes gene_type:complete